MTHKPDDNPRCVVCDAPIVLGGCHHCDPKRLAALKREHRVKPHGTKEDRSYARRLEDGFGMTDTER